MTLNPHELLEISMTRLIKLKDQIKLLDKKVHSDEEKLRKVEREGEFETKGFELIRIKQAILKYS